MRRTTPRPPALAGALALAAAVALVSTAGTALAHAGTRTRGATTGAPTPSRELWATIDICGPHGEPNTVGLRGSMPGDGHAGDKMYMSFRLQYMLAGSTWADVSLPGSGWVLVGAGGGPPRQDGTTFALKPAAGAQPYELRGVVDFQWRRAGRVVRSASAPTSAGHKSLAGAKPPGYSAATCSIS